MYQPTHDSRIPRTRKRSSLWAASTLLALVLALGLIFWRNPTTTQRADSVLTDGSNLVYPRLDSNATSVALENALQPRAITPYNPNNWFDWINFPSERERNMILSAMVGSVSMMIETVKVIQQNPLQPSFQRYFRTEDLPTVVNVYEALLAVLGMEDYERLRECLRVNKLQIWYGNGPGQNLCATTGAYAYSWDYDDSAGFPHHYISYCPPFFAIYRAFDFVPCSRIGPSSDPGERGIGTIWSASLTTLHEMTHWAELTIEIAQLEIDDVTIRRPDGQLTKAYESFYSMQVKNWGGGKKPTTNADCYVMTVAEIFYSHLCPQLGPWQDPPPTNKIWPPTTIAQIPKRM